MARLIDPEAETLEELPPPTFEERRRAILEAGQVGDPEWASPAYHSADDPEWGARRGAALERRLARHRPAE